MTSPEAVPAAPVVTQHECIEARRLAPYRPPVEYAPIKSTTMATRQRRFFIGILAIIFGLIGVGVATGAVINSRPSDSYQLGYQSGVDWTNTRGFFMAANGLPLETMCGHFADLVGFTYVGWKSYDQMMGEAFIDNSQNLVDLPVPAENDFSRTEFSSGCEDGVKSTRSGAQEYS